MNAEFLEWRRAETSAHKSSIFADFTSLNAGVYFTEFPPPPSKSANEVFYEDDNNLNKFTGAQRIISG